MNTENLTINVIDRLKRNNTSRLRQIVFIATISLVLLIIYLPDINTLSIEPIILKGLMILFAGILVPFGLAFAFKVPNKGKIIFLNSSILTQIGKTKIEIPIDEQAQITFYNFNEIEDGSTYFIEIKIKEKILLFELDIVFAKEKAELEKIKNNWRIQGIDFEEKNTPPNRAASR
ncbi:hypothetical protein DMA11_22610 [Marinilabiliaceae bacterium JC017]|nr:hypothetical protein DMA11_22610 [Marinilabiliaceae bacterium JC017]